MERLITKEIVEKYCRISISVSREDFNRFIEEAQDFDLKKLVCEEFYEALFDNRKEASWQIILNGGDYTYEDKERTFTGIVKALSYFSYARFMLMDNVQSTRTGFVQKQNPHSNPISLEDRKEFAKNYRRNAYLSFADFKKGMDRYYTSNDAFTSWNCDGHCSGESKNSSSFEIDVL